MLPLILVLTFGWAAGVVAVTVAMMRRRRTCLQSYVVWSLLGGIPVGGSAYLAAILLHKSFAPHEAHEYLKVLIIVYVAGALWGYAMDLLTPRPKHGAVARTDKEE